MQNHLRLLVFGVMTVLGILLVQPSLAQEPMVTTDLEFAKGELALVRQDYVAAETHFSNVVTRNPQSARGHYFLGASYFAQDKKDLAKAEFEKVVEIGAPPDFVAQAQKYLEALAGKTPAPKNYEVNLATGFRYDSNVYLDSDALNIIGDQDAPIWDTYLRGAIYPLRRENLDLGLEYSFFNALYFDQSGFSFNSHRVGGILNWHSADYSLIFNPGFSSTFVEYGGDLYQMEGELPFLLRADWNNYLATELAFRFAIDDYFNAGTESFVITNSFQRDRLGYYPGVEQYFYLFERRLMFNLGLTVMVEDADNPYDIWGPDLHARVGFPLPAEIYGEVGAGFIKKYYFHDDVPDVGFTPNAIEREDYVGTVTASVRRQIWGPIWISGGYQWENNMSNELAFDYQKHVGTLYLGADL